MPPFLGNLQPHDPATDWQLYELSITKNFTLNDIAAQANANDTDRQKSALLATVGIRAFVIISSLCAPANPSTKT